MHFKVHFIPVILNIFFQIFNERIRASTQLRKHLNKLNTNFNNFDITIFRFLPEKAVEPTARSRRHRFPRATKTLI
jgi:hypothetical protein